MAERLRNWLRNDGWKEDVITADAMVGEITYTKDKLELSLSYVDTGLTPAEFTIRGSRVALETANRQE